VFKVGWFVSLKINRQYVEARVHFAVWQLPHVMASEPPEYAALTMIDGQVGGSHGARGSRLHLDKTERLALPGNQVKVAWRARRMPVTSDYNIAAAHEPEKRGALAFDARPEVQGGRGFAPDGCSTGDAVEGLHG